MSKTIKLPESMNKILSDELLFLGLAENSEAPDGSEIYTRIQQLAQLVWEYALGEIEETKITSSGKKVKYTMRPQQWAIETIFNRLEGRPATAQDDVEDTGRKILDKIDDLDRSRMDRLSKKHGYDSKQKRTDETEVRFELSETGEVLERPGDGETDS